MSASEHPVYLFRQQARIERIQCLMWTVSPAESLREIQEVALVDPVEHLDRGPLDDLVLQGHDPKGPLPYIRFGDVSFTNGLGPVGAALEPLGKLLEVSLHVLSVLVPGLYVHAGGGIPLQAEVGLPQRVRIVDAVRQRREQRPFIFLGRTTYLPARLLHVIPGPVSGEWLALPNSLWPAPFPPYPSQRGGWAVVPLPSVLLQSA